jgi:hypothetical protein
MGVIWISLFIMFLFYCFHWLLIAYVVNSYSTNDKKNNKYLYMFYEIKLLSEEDIFSIDYVRQRYHNAVVLDINSRK